MHTKLGWNNEGADLQVTHIAMSASTHLLLVPFNLPSYSAPLPGCLYLSFVSSTSPGSFLLGAPQWSLSLVGDILAFDPSVFGSDVAPPGLSELRWPFPGARQCHIHLKKKNPGERLVEILMSFIIRNSNKLTWFCAQRALVCVCLCLHCRFISALTFLWVVHGWLLLLSLEGSQFWRVHHVSESEYN